MMLRRTQNILVMKCIMILFLSYMLVNTTMLIYRSFELVKAESAVNTYINDAAQEKSFEICGRNWSLYGMAFVLGAYWNVPKIRKFGVI